uniref:MICOS complex subunit n=1 Tax=Corethrella appendiculata TaxID=1370023 RepID=U5ER15_9DIPT
MFQKIGLFTLGAAVITKSDGKPAAAAKEEKKLICKPSNLPLYAPINHVCECEKKKCKSEPSQAAKTIEEGIRVVRVQLCSVAGSFSSQKKQIVDFYEDGKKQTKFIVDYLNEEDNSAPRIGAIAIGGLAGLIFGLRGGFIRRVLYTSIGAGGIASICYPKEAEIYFQHGLAESKKYATISYNFVYGVKPGDKQLELPQIPTNLSEIKDSVSGLAKSAYGAVFPDKK